MRTQSETETPNCGSRRIVQVSLTKKKKRRRRLSPLAATYKYSMIY